LLNDIINNEVYDNEVYPFKWHTTGNVSHKFENFVDRPCLAFEVGKLLHLPSAEAVSVRPNARPQK